MRVVSFCHYLQGPAAAQYLADMGADVIKIEPPGGAYERHWSGGNTYRRRRQRLLPLRQPQQALLAVDLKHPDGKAVVERLLASADVRDGELPAGRDGAPGLRLRADAKRIKPDIIYASATGFGRVRADGRAPGPGPPDPGLFRPRRGRPAISTSGRRRSACRGRPARRGAARARHRRRLRQEAARPARAPGSRRACSMPASTCRPSR